MIFFCGISNCGGRPQGAPIGYPQQKALTRRYSEEGKVRRKKVFLEIESGLQRKGPAGQSGLCSFRVAAFSGSLRQGRGYGVKEE